MQQQMALLYLPTYQPIKHGMQCSNSKTTALDCRRRSAGARRRHAQRYLAGENPQELARRQGLEAQPLPTTNATRRMETEAADRHWPTGSYRELHRKLATAAAAAGGRLQSAKRQLIESSHLLHCEDSLHRHRWRRHYFSGSIPIVLWPQATCITRRVGFGNRLGRASAKDAWVHCALELDMHTVCVTVRARRNGSHRVIMSLGG